MRARLSSKTRRKGRWCRRRILLKPKVAGSSPALHANASSSMAEHRITPQPFVPRLLVSAKLSSKTRRKSRWCRQRVLRERMMRVRIPPRLQSRRLTVGHSLMFCCRLFPGLYLRAMDSLASWKEPVVVVTDTSTLPKGRQWVRIPPGALGFRMLDRRAPRARPLHFFPDFFICNGSVQNQKATGGVGRGYFNLTAGSNPAWKRFRWLNWQGNESRIRLFPGHNLRQGRIRNELPWAS